MAKTINFTTIPTDPVVCQELLKLELPFKKDRVLRNFLFKEYRKQLKLSEKLFEEWFEETNGSLIKDVLEFLEKKNSLFTNDARPIGSNPGQLIYTPKLIRAARVALGMDSSDLIPTLDMMMEDIRKKIPKLNILTIGPEIERKAELLNLLDETDESSKLLVVVEQTQLMDKNILKSLVDGLYNRLNDLDNASSSDQGRAVTILFCMMDTSLRLVSLFGTSINRMTTIHSIVKKSRNVIAELRKKLLDSEGVSFRIGPNLSEFITVNVLEEDSSITNLKYLYQYSLYEYYLTHASLVTLPKSDLIKLFEADPSVIDIVRSIKSMEFIKGGKSKVDWTSNSSVAEFCSNSVQTLRDYFNHISAQLNYYLILLIDETQRGFPNHFNDIYYELVTHDRLSHSVNFVDSVKNINQYPIDRLLKRIESIEAIYCPKLAPKPEDEKDVYKILTKFKAKLENNNNECKDLVNDLIGSLLQHARHMKSPTKLPLNEALYFDQVEQVRKRTIPSMRVTAKHFFLDQPNYFSILCNLIQKSTDEIDETHLFNDFKQIIEADSSLNNLNSIPEKEVSLPTKRASRSAGNQKRSAEERKSKNVKIPIDDDVLKAIFWDTIWTLQYQGIVKREKKKSMKGILRRCVWF